MGERHYQYSRGMDHYYSPDYNKRDMLFRWGSCIQSRHLQPAKSFRGVLQHHQYCVKIILAKITPTFTRGIGDDPDGDNVHKLRGQ